MYRVLIADDELPILQGLQMIIDWHSLGFTVCAAVQDGPAALEQITALQPDLVLMDIRMPGLDGLQVMEAARHRGYHGYFIVLSGISDFGYAQRAIRSRASFYLTKPIDEDELAEAVKQVAAELSSHNSLRSQLEQHTHQKLLFQLFTGVYDFAAPSPALDALHADGYQVVACESYSFELSAQHAPLDTLLCAAGLDVSPDDVISIENREFCLVRGSANARKLSAALTHILHGSTPPAGWEQAFFCFGRSVRTAEEIVVSYCDAVKLMQRRYYCAPERHLVSYTELPAHSEAAPLDTDARSLYAKQLTDCIQVQNMERLGQILQELNRQISDDDQSVTACKLFLTEIYTSVRQQVRFLYRESANTFRSSEASSVKYIEESQNLTEALRFLYSQFEAFAQTVHTGTSEDVIVRMRQYIDRNCSQPLRLEDLAELFGYNASYLGKLFREKMQCSFNEYIDKVRIERAKELLGASDLKVYEIAAQLGYKDVDYFHKKFKKYTGVSPNEYRRTPLAKEWFITPPPRICKWAVKGERNRQRIGHPGRLVSVHYNVIKINE